jgi:hypothetical protein
VRRRRRLPAAAAALNIPDKRSGDRGASQRVDRSSRAGSHPCGSLHGHRLARRGTLGRWSVRRSLPCAGRRSQYLGEVPTLMNLPMHDGSRQFGSLPQKVLWHGVRDHVARLRGAAVTKLLCDDVTEAWVDFSCGGHAFTINDQFGEYCSSSTTQPAPTRSSSQCWGTSAASFAETPEARLSLRGSGGPSLRVFPYSSALPVAAGAWEIGRVRAVARDALDAHVGPRSVTWGSPRDASSWRNALLRRGCG